MMTVLEAQVDLDRADDLVREYREGTSQIPPEILQTSLVRDARDATRYRIVTVWKSEAALQAMRASGITPKGRTDLSGCRRQSRTFCLRDYRAAGPVWVRHCSTRRIELAQCR